MATQDSFSGSRPRSRNVNLYQAIRDNNLDLVKTLIHDVSQHTSPLFSSALHLAVDPWRNSNATCDKPRLQRLTAQIIQLLSQQPIPTFVEPVTPHPSLQANLEILQELLANLPDPNPVDPQTNLSPLHVAIQQDPLEPLLALVGGAACLEDLLHSDPPKVLRLLRAIFCHNNAVVKLFLDHGAEPNCPGSREVAPLLKAVEHGKVCITYHLLRKGACVHHRDGDKRTPLHLAAREARWYRGLRFEGDLYPDLLAEQSRHLVDFLLSYDAEPNADDEERVSPLHEAMKLGNVDAIELLLQRGGDMRHMDSDEHTPWHRVMLPGSRARAEDILKICELEDLHKIMATQIIFYSLVRLGDLNGGPMALVSKLICEKYALATSKDIIDTSDYVRECHAEIERMEGALLCSSFKFTMLDILKRDTDWLGRLLLMNDDVRRAVETADFEKTYKNYAEMLKHRIGQGMRKMEALKRSFGVVKTMLNQVAFVPTECVWKILSFFNATEVTFLEVSFRLRE